MAERPNILIFMTDHQRADTVLPEHPAQTPNLTRFVGESVTFTNAFCPSPHCCPSRATFFTGLYPTSHGVWNNLINSQALSRGLKPGVKLWSEDMAAAGYRMHFAGKWHVSAEEWPRDRAWTEHYVSAGPTDSHGVGWDVFRRLAGTPEPAERGDGQILRPGYGAYQTYGARGENKDEDELPVRRALEALPEIAAGGDPWCLYVGTIGPHDPYFVQSEYLNRYDLKDVPLPANFADTLDDKPRVYRRMARQLWGQLTEREIREAIRHYWAYCTYLDERFGQVLEGLAQTGQADNTAVIYCSDHGDYAGEHGLFCKGIPSFRGAYNVPAVVRWPRGGARAGAREDALVSLADFGPTFLELAGLRPERRFSGASLAPFLRGEQPENWREDIHSQCNGTELYYTQRAVSTRDHKYVFNGFDDDELYDLRADPLELVNRADDPACAAVKRDLVRRMWRFAAGEDDGACSQYITVGLAPWGPAEAFRD